MDNPTDVQRGLLKIWKNEYTFIPLAHIETCLQFAIVNVDKQILFSSAREKQTFLPSHVPILRLDLLFATGTPI